MANETNKSAETGLTTQAKSCSVCGASMEPDASRCEKCGATRGEQHKCPFCGVIAEAQAGGRVRYQCPACGAPRIPLASAHDRLSKHAVERLGKARRAHASATAWKAAAAVTAGFGLLSTLILTGIAMIANPPMIPVVVGYLLCALPLLFAGLAVRNGKRRDRELDHELDDAWLEAARGLTMTRGLVRAPDLADALRIDKPQAEALLLRLAALDEIRSDVTEAGEMALSTRAPQRMRVGEVPDTGKATKAPEEPEPAPAAVEAEGSEPRGGKAGA